MRRFLFPAAALLIAASCSTTNNTTPTTSTVPGKPPSPGVVCPGAAKPHHMGPIVCLDSDTLNATPDPIRVGRGAWIHFYLNDQNADLDIDFGKAPVEYKGKSGNEVWVRVTDVANYGTYKYTATNVSNGHSKDPDILIEP